MDIAKIKSAKEYMDKLANGINPLDNSTIPEYDIVNNVHLSRCFFFVSDVLRQMIENGEETPKKKAGKEPFTISYEQLQAFEFSNSPISLSEIVRRINHLNEEKRMKKLSFDKVANWLVKSGFLKLETNEEGKKTRRPTKAGNDIGIGITTQIRKGKEYSVVVYDQSAQQFIIDNLEAVIEVDQLDSSEEKTASKEEKTALPIQKRSIDIFV